jgi:hypothetical protein
MIGVVPAVTSTLLCSKASGYQREDSFMAMADNLILVGSILVILGGAAMVVVWLWVRGPGRRTAQLGPDGRSVQAVPPYQLAVGLVAVLYGMVRLVTL